MLPVRSAVRNAYRLRPPRLGFTPPIRSSSSLLPPTTQCIRFGTSTTIPPSTPTPPVLNLYSYFYNATPDPRNVTTTTIRSSSSRADPTILHVRHLGSLSARKRISLSGRIDAGIRKPSSIRSIRSMRPFSTNIPAQNKKKINNINRTQQSALKSSSFSPAAAASSTSTRLTWRDATKSPMKALRYSNQLRKDFVEWCKHIWTGAKLLAADVRVSTGILRRVAKGKELTRRERNFIVQTGVDLARLVPFSLFLIIPAAEFALPFALRLFPNMLPSQFQDSMKKQENLKKTLKGRIEIAKYLRDVVEQNAKRIKDSSRADSELKKDAENLGNFIDAIRSGKPVDPADVAKFARLFSDEITIDGAARPQLVAMCKYMGLSTYGNDALLRFKLRSRLNTIKKDDMQIMWEGGVNSLTDEEVIKACQDRGIHTVDEATKQFINKKQLREQLTGWLDLSQRKEIPSSLLIMSRAFFYDGLQETIGSLPEEVIMEVKQAESNQERLEEARRQAKLIAMESEAEERKEREEEERRKKKEEEEEIIAAAEVVENDNNNNTSPSTAAEYAELNAASDKDVMKEADAREAKLKEEFFDTKPLTAAHNNSSAASMDGEDTTSTTTTSPAEEKDEEELHKETEDIRKLLVSLGELASESAVEKERAELADLKEELSEAESAIAESGSSAGSELKRFKAMVRKLEREVEKVDAVVGLRMKLLDQDNDGMMSFEECKNIMGVLAGDPDDKLVAETLRRLDADADGNISKNDLARLLLEVQGESSALDTIPPVSAPSSKS